MGARSSRSGPLDPGPPQGEARKKKKKKREAAPRPEASRGPPGAPGRSRSRHFHSVSEGSQTPSGGEPTPSRATLLVPPLPLESASEDRPNYGATTPQKQRRPSHLTHKESAELLRRESLVLLTHEESAAARDHFEYPSARFLALTHIAHSLGYCGYTLTSWLFVSIQHKNIWPSCSARWGGLWSVESVACSASILVFWTFPLFLCLYNLAFSYQDLLKIRLYYEMFSHRVNIDYKNLSFWGSPGVWAIIAVTALSCSVYPMAGKLSLRDVFMTLPYWIPIVSFVCLLYSMWDTESRLLSVAKFVERDPEWATEHLADSYFITDFVAEASFNSIVRDMKEQFPSPKLTTGEFILEIAAEAERIITSSPRRQKAQLRKLSTTSVQNPLHAVFAKYWVRELLWSPFLVDPEAAQFHFWFSVYCIYSLVLAGFIVLLFALTVVDHLHEQSFLDDSWLTRWFNLNYLNVVPAQARSAVAGGASTPLNDPTPQISGRKHFGGTTSLVIAAVAFAWVIIFCVASFIVHRWHVQMRDTNRRPRCGPWTMFCGCCCTWLACCFPIDAADGEYLIDTSPTRPSSTQRAKPSSPGISPRPRLGSHTSAPSDISTIMDEQVPTGAGGPARQTSAQSTATSADGRHYRRADPSEEITTPVTSATRMGRRSESLDPVQEITDALSSRTHDHDRPY